MSKLSEAKSILTESMLRADAKSDGSETDEQTTSTSNKFALKRFSKKMAWTALGTAAAMTVLVVIANRLGEDEDTSEDETSDS